MGEVLKLKIQLRRDTVANWVLYDPVLLNGEAAVSSDLNQIKIGDGVSKWSELEYVSGGDGLQGFTQAEVGSYPIKQEDGTLKWVKPSELTVEGIQDDLNSIKATIATLPTDISINGDKLTSVNGIVDIPVATLDRLGAVKGSAEISVADDGTLGINSMDVSKLTQEENLILYGGDSITN